MDTHTVLNNFTVPLPICMDVKSNTFREQDIKSRRFLWPNLREDSTCSKWFSCGNFRMEIDFYSNVQGY